MSDPIQIGIPAFSAQDAQMVFGDDWRWWNRCVLHIIEDLSRYQELNVARQLTVRGWCGFLGKLAERFPLVAPLRSFLAIADELRSVDTTTTEPLTRGPRFGSIYFVRQGDFIKIVFSSDWKSRVQSLQTAAPQSLEVLLVVPGGPADERELHQRFAEHREHGEWFRLEGSLKKWIAAGCPNA